MEDLIGKTLGNYRILEEIGRGGMGVVYRASQMSLNRVVAIKVLPPQFTFDPSFITRFKREAASAAKLDHPGIVKIFDIGEEGDIHFFSMEFLKGESLEAVLRREGKLSIKKSLDITVRVARALHYAHGQGITHRDIKPGNIIVDRSSQVKVTDFGLALPSEGTRITATGGILGTPEYMSPEQAAGGDVGPQSDIYSLGILLYEMLSGQVPFDADTPGALMQQHQFAEPKKISQVLAAVPPNVEPVLDKMLAKDLSERYQNAKDLVSDLSGIRATVITTKRKESRVAAPAAKVSETKGSRKWLVAVAAGVVLAVGIGLLALVRGGGERTAAPPGEAPRTVIEGEVYAEDGSGQQAALTQELERKERLLNNLLRDDRAVASAVARELDDIEADAGSSGEDQIEALEEQIAVVEDALINKASLGVDIVRLKTGTSLKGAIVSESAQSIMLKTDLGTSSIEKDRIVSVKRATSAEKRLADELRERIAAREAARSAGIVTKILNAISNIF